MGVNVKLLQKVAGLDKEKDDLSNFIADNDSPVAQGIRAALIEQRQIEQKAAVVQAASEITSLIKQAVSTREYLVDKIRKARAEERAALASLEEIQMAEAYGQATMNFIPLAYTLTPTVAFSSANNDHVIPEDFATKWKADRAAKRAEATGKKTAKTKS